MGLIEVEDGRLFNSAMWWIVAHSSVANRKAHLLGGEQIFDAGNDSPIFEIAGLRFGINICYDTNFPEAARKVARPRCILIVCPANNMHHRRRRRR